MLGGSAGEPSADETDYAALRRAWLATETREDIERMLKTAAPDRPTAYAALKAELTAEVEPRHAFNIIDGATQTRTEISVRVANAGCSATFFGAVRAVKRIPDWTNILDPGLHLHVKDAEVATAWVARAPTRQGLFTWIDFLTDAGGSVVQIFGRRPDGASLCTQGPGCWRALISDFVFEPMARERGRL